MDGPSLTAINLAITSGNGTLVDNSNGTWSYTPALNDDTSVTFSYAVSDGIAAPVATTATLDITPVNDGPTTTPVTLTAIAEDSGPRLITQAELLANATDVDGPSLTAINLAISAGNGTLVDNSNGTWSYSPALNDDTSVTFSYAVSDGIAAPVATTASLDITPVNDAPVTTPVTLAAIGEDSGTRLITQAELLANATDVDGPSLTAINLSISSGSGTLVDNSNGTWSYTPALNDDTSVTFSYAVTDGVAAPVATTATLDITPVNETNIPPVTTPVTLTPIAEDSGTRLITQAELLANASDVDGPSLTAINLAITSGNGTLVDNGNGTWSYTPAANDDTSVTFSYAVTDGVAAPVATTATLDITPVNDAPVTTPVTLAAIAEDSGTRLITQAELLANASDVDGPSLTAINLSIASGSGTLVDNGNGTWSYTPAANDDTSVTFSYAVTDGVAAPVATTATLDITPVRDDAAGDHAGDACGDCRGQRDAADHAGGAAGQCLGRGRTVADGHQPLHRLRQRHVGRQRQRHLELHAGAQRRHLGDVQLRGDGRRRGAGGNHRHPGHHSGERRAGDIAGDAGRDRRGQRSAADHAGRAAGQRLGRGRTFADGDQPGDRLGQRHPGRQRQRHLELHAGAQRRHLGDVQLRGDGRRRGAGGATATPRHHSGERRAGDDAGDAGGDRRGQRSAADHAGRAAGQRHGRRRTVADAPINLAIASGNGTLVDNGNGTWSYTPALNDDTSVTLQLHGDRRRLRRRWPSARSTSRR